MKMKYYLLALIIPVLFGSCDDTDDVAGIFLGKTWKLTNIYPDKTNPTPVDYWGGDEAARNKSYELLGQKGKFIIQFNGVVTDGIISGTYTGYATSTSFSGKWDADGDKKTFKIYPDQPVTDSDPLGNAFIKGFNTSTEYSGDYNQLSLFFRDGSKKYILFRPEKE